MVRALSPVIIRLAMVLACCAWLPATAEAQGANVQLRCATDGVDVGSQFDIEMLIDVGPDVLGAYTVAINYDPTVFSVTGVAAGETEQFSLLPTANPAEFSTGRTRISAFNTASLTEPTGMVSVAEVGISVLNAPNESAPIEVEVVTLADVEGVRIEDVTTEACAVRFANVTPRATSTEVLTSPTPSPVSTSTPPPATASLPPAATPTATPTKTDDIPATATEIPCPGDCNSDQKVTADELIVGVNIALKRSPIDECQPLDRTADREVDVDEIITAVGMALHGCAGRSPTMTPTRPPNRPPVVVPMGIYQAFPEHEIHLPIGATDPDGDALRCEAEDVPEGADLDAESGVFSWTPGAQQVGPFYVSYTCTDDGEPPLSTEGRLVFQVSALDGCVLPVCDPASGCSARLSDLSGECCGSDAPVRVGQAAAECPAGLQVSVGRNLNGFGRLQNCDRFRIVNFVQTGAVARFHIRVKCMNKNGPVSLHARMETSDRLLFDEDAVLELEPSDGDVAEYHSISFAVGGDPPFFDLEGAEANFAVTVKDADGLEAGEALRLRLTFDPLADLAD